MTSPPELGPMPRGRALAGGIGRYELAGPLWRRPYRDVHVWRCLDAADPVLRTAEAAALLPSSAAIGGWAAARLLGAVDFDGESAAGELMPVLLCLSRPQRVLVRPGIRTFRSDLLPEDVVEVDGVPVTSAVRTCFDVGRLAPTAEDAVVELDSAVRDLGVSVEDLSGYARERRRWRGVPQLLRALGLVDVRSASRGESRLRWCWVIEAGLPRPEVNCEVRDLDGRLLGVPDLLDSASGLVGEYDGRHHRQLDRYTADNVREEGLERAGLVVARATGLDVGPDRRRLVWRLQDAYRQARTRHGPPGWILGPYRATRQDRVSP